MPIIYENKKLDNNINKITGSVVVGAWQRVLSDKGNTCVCFLSRFSLNIADQNHGENA
jgi:hypothetical protein